MHVNDANLETAFKGFKAIYNQSFETTVSHLGTMAMTVNSNTSEENYGWLGQFPMMREWIGDRQLKQLASHGFTIKNKKFESTVTIKREDFDDDRYGIYNPFVSEMGRVAKQHPDKMLFEMLEYGFTQAGFDDVPFFSEDHPVSQDVNSPGASVTVSNYQDGTDPAWYLIDASRAIKPMIWQVRDDYDLQTINNPRTNESVFMRDEFYYGIRARVNCGFGLWHLAFGSKAELTPENYAAARAAMMKYTGDDGQLLGVMPTHLIVSSDNETAGRSIVNADLVTNTSNIWKGTAELIVSPFLS